jgi:hypothetical protein
MCDWPAWLAARPVARMNEAKSGNERNAAPDIASLIRATSSIASSLLAITARYDFAFSRRDAPELCVFLRLENQRAQGKPGARCTRGRACSVESTRVNHHRFTGTPGLPCATVLRLISSSPRGPGFVAPVIGVMRSIITHLTPASGCQDHTTSPSAR